MNPDFGSPFQSFVLTDKEAAIAVQVSPYFYAFLQNKIAAYATEVLKKELPYDPDPAKQLKAILEFEKYKNYVTILEELLNEVTTEQLAQVSGTDDAPGPQASHS